jgi:hypothetical protein
MIDYIDDLVYSNKLLFYYLTILYFISMIVLHLNYKYFKGKNKL